MPADATLVVAARTSWSPGGAGFSREATAGMVTLHVMSSEHLHAILTTANAKQGKEGWWELGEGTSISLHLTHGGVGLVISKGVAVREENTFVYFRTARGEIFVVNGHDIFAGTVDGTTTTSRKAGFSP